MLTASLLRYRNQATIIKAILVTAISAASKPKSGQPTSVVTSQKFLPSKSVSGVERLPLYREQRLLPEWLTPAHCWHRLGIILCAQIPA